MVLWFLATPQVSLSIAYKELFPVVIPARAWGVNWPCHHVLFRSDNEAVGHIIKTSSSKVAVLMHFSMPKACFSFSFSDAHVPGAQNQIADATCFQWQEFQCLDPHAHPHPTPIP